MASGERLPAEQRRRRRARATEPKSKLAAKRLDAGLTQRQVSELTGIPLGTYRRYDRGQEPDPRLRHLTNLALVFECQITDLFEDDWRRWRVYDQRAAEPPARRRAVAPDGPRS